MVWNRIEVAAQVAIDHFAVPSGEQPVNSTNRIVGTSPSPVSILFLGQIGLKDRFQDKDCCHLDHAIFDTGYP